MRLRRNQLCPLHRSLFCCGRETISREKRKRQMGVRRVDDFQHPRGSGRSARMRKCESSWIKKSLPKTASARSAKKSSPTIPTSYPTISIPVAWEERGETTILRTFRRSTGGAMGKRDRAGGDLSPECCRPCSVVRKVPEVGSSDLAGTTLSDKLSLTAHLLLSCASATRIELHLHHNDLQSPLRTAEQNAFG